MALPGSMPSCFTSPLPYSGSAFAQRPTQRSLISSGTPAIARYHQPVSYMVERLTGEAVIDHALASTTMVYDLAMRRYDSELLDAFDIAAGELPLGPACGPWLR